MRLGRIPQPAFLPSLSNFDESPTVDSITVKPDVLKQFHEVNTDDNEG